MWAINIENKELEKNFKEYARKQKIAVNELAHSALKMFLDTKTSADNKPLTYQKRDPKKYLRPINYSYDEDLCSDNALSHIEDSAKFIHELRRKKHE